MKQLLFEFAAEVVAASGTPLDPRIQKELVTRMAAAILAILKAEGGENDEDLYVES